MHQRTTLPAPQLCVTKHSRHASRSCGCSVILSIFWNLWMFADLNNDPLRAMLTNASSSSHQACVAFTATLVQRYSSSPVIVVWEIGNEHNLVTDLDCAGQTWGCAPQMGTPAGRFKKGGRRFQFRHWLNLTSAFPQFARPQIVRLLATTFYSSHLSSLSSASTMLSDAQSAAATPCRAPLPTTSCKYVMSRDVCHVT
jgi:hypothetical protein